MQPRVRFAPSPTGFLHVGGARTALFNWLYARRESGVFVLRIEDTDRARSSEEMVRAILDGLSWLGLDWDEGPIHQADGLERHRNDAFRLLESGAAYRCFCTPEELEARRAAAGADSDAAYTYDRHCLSRIDRDEAERRAAAGEPFTVRVRVPEGTTAWDDAVHGAMSFENKDLDDFIVLRSDGTPVYNMAVMSDDAHMGITHVIRGDDHISNTPKQILLYAALGFPVPRFAHVPMILGADGKRLSKRHGATAVGEYRRQGILPGAMVNFLALLGWSPGDDREVMGIDELIQAFSLARINRKSAVFDTEKLHWLNGQHINRMPPEKLEPLVTQALSAGGADTDGLADRGDWYTGLIELLKDRARTVDDIADQALPYLADVIEYQDAAMGKYWKQPAQVRDRLMALRDRFESLDVWDAAALETELRALAEELQVGAGKLIHPLRVALLGTTVSPGIFDVVLTLGRQTTLARIDRAVDRLEGMAAGP